MPRVARPSKTMQEAEAAVEAARHMADKARRPERRKEKAASAETAPLPVPFRNYRDKIASAETAPLQMAETAPLSIYPGGDRRDIRAAAAAPTPAISAATATIFAPAATATVSAAEPSACPAAPTLAFPLIDGFYRIAGRADPMIEFAERRPTLPLEKPNAGAAHAVAAE